MITLYKPLLDGHYKRIMVQDTTPYLGDGWFNSISDHQAYIAKLNSPPVETHLFGAPPEKPKQKRKQRKKPEAE